MVKLIFGSTGSGKTKTIIDMVNSAVKEAKGNVVCIAKGDKLKFDISYDARLINVDEYAVRGFDQLMGFVAGMHAGNYDICQFYIDDLGKVAGSKDDADCENFLKELDAFATKHEVDFVIAVNGDESGLTEEMKKYL